MTSPPTARRLPGRGIDAREWTGVVACGEVADGLRSATHVLSSIPPPDEGAPVVRHFAHDIAAAREMQSAYLDWISAKSLGDIQRDPDLLNFANAGGRAAFAENCAPCHGVGAAGGPGYPNLADDDWLWPGDLEGIYLTIRHGVRWPEDDDSRNSDMPRFGDDELLTRAQISDVSEYVLSFTKTGGNAGAIARGAAIYKEQCVACHGAGGEGNTEVGAPRLNDAIWFYGDDPATVAAQIAGPQQGVMPAWQGRLDDITLKMLTVYVHSLGGGQ